MLALIGQVFGLDIDKSAIQPLTLSLGSRGLGGCGPNASMICRFINHRLIECLDEMDLPIGPEYMKAKDSIVTSAPIDVLCL